MTSTHALGQFLRTLPHSAAATFLALFPIVDPFGGIPIFFTMTSSWTARDRRNTAVKTGLWVFVILVTFLFFGRFVLHFFGISLPVLKIAGGLIVANTAWGMVTSHARITPEESHEAQVKEDISLTPLAMSGDWSVIETRMPQVSQSNPSLALSRPISLSVFLTIVGTDT